MTTSRPSVPPAVTMTARLLGWAGWSLAIGSLVLLVWCAVASSLSVDASIKATEDPVARSLRLTREAEQRLMRLEAERKWLRKEVDAIKREQGLEDQ